MKILITADTKAGWTNTIDLIRMLGELGVTATLATIGIPNPEQRAQAKSLGNLEMRTSDYRLGTTEIDLIHRWLAYLEKETQPDLILLNNFAVAPLPSKVPVVIAGQDYSPDRTADIYTAAYKTAAAINAKGGMVACG